MLLESVGVVVFVAGGVVTGIVMGLQRVGIIPKPKTYNTQEAQAAAAAAWRDEAEANAAGAARLERMYAALELRVDELKTKLAAVEEKNAELEKRPDFTTMVASFAQLEELVMTALAAAGQRDTAFLGFVETATNRLEEIAVAVVPPAAPNG